MSLDAMRFDAESRVLTRDFVGAMRRTIAAGQAVKDAGTEVAPTEVGGQGRGPRGRWAVLLRRRPDVVATALDPEPDPGQDSEPGSMAAEPATSASGQATTQVTQPGGELGHPR